MFLGHVECSPDTTDALGLGEAKTQEKNNKVAERSKDDVIVYNLEEGGNIEVIEIEDDWTQTKPKAYMAKCRTFIKSHFGCCFICSLLIIMILFLIFGFWMSMSSQGSNGCLATIEHCILSYRNYNCIWMI